MEGIIFQLLSKLGETTGKDQIISLKPGEIVRVYVKEVLGDQALLRFQGALMLARLEAPVQEGARLRCLVQGDKDGQVLLKLLPDEGTASQKINDFISGLLKNASLPNNEFSRQVISSMLKQGMPIAKEAVETLLSAAQKLGVSSGEIDTLVFLHKQGVPLERGNLQAVAQPLNSPESLGQQAAALRNLLTDLVRNQIPGGTNESGATNGKLPLREIINISNKILNLLNEVTAQQNEKAGNIIPKLIGSQFKAGQAPVTVNNEAPQAAVLTGREIGNQGVPSVNPEQVNLLNTLNQRSSQAKALAADRDALSTGADMKALKEAGNAEVTGGLRGESKGALAAAGEETLEVKHASQQEAYQIKPVKDEIVPRLIRLVQEGSGLNSKELAAKFSLILEEHIRLIGSDSGERLPELLNKLQELLKQEPEPVFREVLARTVQLSDSLSSFQQLNKNQGQEQFFIVQSLINPENPEGAYEMMIRIKKEAADRVVNYENCQVVVSLNTLHLGLVRAFIRVNKREMVCKLQVEQEQFKQVVDRKLDQLQVKLREIGFDVTLYPTEVKRVFKSSLQELIDLQGEPPKIGNVDIRI